MSEKLTSTNVAAVMLACTVKSESRVIFDLCIQGLFLQCLVSHKAVESIWVKVTVMMWYLHNCSRPLDVSISSNGVPFKQGDK